MSHELDSFCLKLACSWRQECLYRIPSLLSAGFGAKRVDREAEESPKGILFLLWIPTKCIY